MDEMVVVKQETERDMLVLSFPVFSCEVVPVVLPNNWYRKHSVVCSV